MRVHLVSLGCAKNLIDSEAILGAAGVAASRLILADATIAACLGFVGWVARDARRTARSLRQQRLQAGTREDGEGTSPDGDHD